MMMQENKTLPNKKNFCGGNFPDWLEVYLTGRCNGKCSFCIEKNGFRPKESVNWRSLADTIINSNKKNILLLGGEPTLYSDLSHLIICLSEAGLNVCMTTNGSSLMNRIIWSEQLLFQLKTLNVSIHHYDLDINKEITGISLEFSKLKSTIKKLHGHGVTIRINCNIIEGYIDSRLEVLNFIEFAKKLGVDGVRFAELKNDDRFVDLADIFPGQYGLNKNPFINGCWQNAEINGMAVNFRQLCGMQSDKRPTIINPKQILKKVLYYDGKLYDGWQSVQENDMNKTQKKWLESMLEITLDQVRDGDLTTKAATKALMKIMTSAIADFKIDKPVSNGTPVSSGTGCAY
jgi:pyruvate-formate lyase-activating enzyme